MLNFVLIGISIISGVLVQKLKALPADSHKAVNAWVINVALPAMALKYIPQIEWDISLILPFSMPFIVWGGSYLFIRFISNFIRMDAETRTALVITAGLGNTSFLGFPLTEAYYGDQGLRIAVLCDQACFIVMATFGIMTATKTSQGGLDIRKILKRIFLFPPFIAFCLAFILPPFVNFDPVAPLFDNLAATLIPLALFSVGLQLQLRDWRSDVRLIAAALSYKLILAPLFIFLICLAIGITGITAKVSVFEAAMAPMVTATIIAVEYKLRPKLANIILSIGIPVSLITTYIWYLVLSQL